MATLAPEQAATTIDDYDAITSVVQLYIDGSGAGNAEKLRAAFHPDARMFGQELGKRYDVPIEELFKFVASGPMDTDGRYRGRVTWVTQVGDSAVAAVVLEGCWGTVTYHDHLSLVKIDGSWKIVNKIFALTAGTPPPV